MKLELSREEIYLLRNSLESDTQGNWGDTRSLKLADLLGRLNHYLTMADLEGAK